MSAATASGQDVLALVLRALRASVDVAEDEIAPDTELLDLPEFDSMKIVQVVEEIEETLDLEIDPDRIVPETFTSPRTLADTVASALRADAPGQAAQEAS